MKMTDNEIIKALKCCHGQRIPDCDNCPNDKTCEEIDVLDSVIDLINRQKAEIERLEKENEELIYKLEYLLSYATGNKLSKYTYTKETMESYVGEHIQECCDKVEQEMEIKLQAMRNAASGYKADVEKLEKEIAEANSIERKNELQALKENKGNAKLFLQAIQLAKSEAIKEFAEQLKKRFYLLSGRCVVDIPQINNLVKEMTEEEK